MIGKKRPGKNRKLPGGTRESPKRGTVDESGLAMTNIAAPVVIDAGQTPDSGCGDSTGSVGDSGAGSSGCDSGGGGDAS